jgi:AraC family transcriptional regulator
MDPTPRHEDRLMRVINYIYGHLDGDLSLDTLAEVAAMSRFHWHRIYRGLASETIADTIRRVRLSRGARELVQSKRTIADVAAACGYLTLRSFERSFLEAYNMTPSAFRAAGKQPSPLVPLAKAPGPKVAIEVRMIEPMRIAALLHVGPFEELGTTMHRALALAKTRGTERLGPPMAAFLSDPDMVPPHERRAEAGFPVGPRAIIASPFHEVWVSGGRYAVGGYRGPYVGLPDAWDRFCGAWFADATSALRDAPPFEVYVDDPNEVGPAAILTEMYLPIE